VAVSTGRGIVLPPARHRELLKDYHAAIAHENCLEIIGGTMPGVSFFTVIRKEMDAYEKGVAIINKREKGNTCPV
jgi:hypothetical protein